MLVLARATTSVVALAFLSVGCGTILGLDDFVDPQPSSTAGSGADGTGAGGPGAAGGAGGAGSGGGPIGGNGGHGGQYTCNSSNEFMLFGPGELGADELDDERLVVLGDANDMRAHVAIVSNTSRQIIARTVRSNKEVGTTARYPTTPNTLNDLRIMGGYILDGTIRLAGSFDGQAGEVVVSAQPDVSPNPAPALIPYDSPANCGTNELHVQRDASGPRYASTCYDMGNVFHMYGGAAGAPHAYDFTGSSDDPTMDLNGYGHVGDVDVLVTMGEFSAGADTYYRFGKTAAALATTYPLQPDPGLVTLPFGMVPNPAGDGVVFFTISVDPDSLATNGGATLRSGTVPLAELAQLSTSPATYLKHTVEVAKTAEITVFHPPKQLGPLLVSAGAAYLDPIAADTLRFHMWQTDGTPLVSGHVIATAPDDVDYTAAAAAPISPAASLVAWIEKSASGFVVKGRLVGCSEN